MIFGLKNILGWKNFVSGNFGPKILSKNLWVQKILGPKNLGAKKNCWFKNLLGPRQQQLRYSWYGHMSPGQMLPGQMSPWQLAFVKYSARNLPLKLGQNWISINWDIPDMDKCHQDKCYLDKCHFDNWHLLKMVTGT